ncbi:MAG: YihY/virulence factor BrkB family protein [Planctomycetota bacterium]
MKFLRKLRDYLTRDLWAVDLSDYPPLVRTAFFLLRTILLAIRGVLTNKVSVWASSLTYLTLIALLPFVALVMGLGAKLGVPMTLVENFTTDVPDATRDVLTRMADAFEQVDFRAVGIISIVLIGFAAMRVLMRIEAAFNEVWGVKRGRHPLKKYAVYGAVIVFGPPLAFGALMATGAVLANDFVHEVTSRSATKAAMQVIVPLFPWIGIWIVLTFLYKMMPATRVRLLPALAGAVVAGSVIQIVQRGMLMAQAGLYQQGWVFGSLAVIPILLVWIYFTWIVVMYGAELSYGIQHAGSYLFLYEDEEDVPTHAETEEMAVRVSLFLASRHASDNGTFNDEQIAEALGAAPRRVGFVLTGLADAKVFKRVGMSRFRLAKSPEATTLNAVIRPFRGPIRRAVAMRDEPSGAHAAVDRLKGIVREPLKLTLAEVLAFEGGGAE